MADVHLLLRLNSFRKLKLKENFMKLTTILAARRRHMLKIYQAILAVLVIRNGKSKQKQKRSCRRYLRNTGWWEAVRDHYSDKRFKKTLRISRKTFDFILDKIRHRLEKETKAEDPICPELRLAICLYRMARGDYNFIISEMVGVGVSTICGIVHEVCEAIVEEMWTDNVQALMPTTDEEFRNKMLDMDEFWQFPFSWAAVDGCHIPIKCPPGGLEACREYHNFKNFYSIVLMGLVDAKYRFIWASCGFPGNSHDSIILQSTNLWRKIQDEEEIPNISQKVGDVCVSPLILGDSAFPHTSWLAKPYTAATLTAQQHYFNYRLSRARMVTEGAFGQLKGRWRILLRKCDSSREEVRSATLACVVLHNVCISQGDTISKKLDLTIDPQTQGRRNRNQIRELLQMRECKKVKSTSVQAQRVRDSLCEKMWNEKISGKIKQ